MLARHLLHVNLRAMCQLRDHLESPLVPPTLDLFPAHGSTFTLILIACTCRFRLRQPIVRSDFLKLGQRLDRGWSEEMKKIDGSVR